jgi:hypothetical protein
MDSALDFGMPRKGDFQHFTLSGPFEPNIDDLLDLRSYHGLHPEGLVVYGTVRDDHGKMYTIARRIPFGVPPAVQEEGGEARKNIGSRLLFQTDRHDESLRFDKTIIKAAGSTDGFTASRTGDSARFASNEETVRGKPWHVELSADRLSWHEDDVLSLSGNVLKPAIQWYLVDRNDSMLYTSIMSEVEGTVLGERVRGFIFLEQSYLAEGGVLYVHRDSMVGHKLEICWYSWGTRWDDGTVEIGHFMVGNDRAGFGIVSNGSEIVVNTSNVSAEVTRDPGGYWHNGIQIDVNGEAWEMVPSIAGRQLDMAKMPNPQQEGLVRRVGETRAPVAWFAWGETAPSHGNLRSNRYLI